MQKGLVEVLEVEEMILGAGRQWCPSASCDCEDTNHPTTTTHLPTLSLGQPHCSTDEEAEA